MDYRALNLSFLVKIILLAKLTDDKRVHQQTRSSGDQTMGWTFPDSTEHKPCCSTRGSLLQQLQNGTNLQQTTPRTSAQTPWEKDRVWGNPEDQPCAHLPATFQPHVHQLVCAVGDVSASQLRGRALKCDLLGARGLE